MTPLFVEKFSALPEPVVRRCSVKNIWKTFAKFKGKHMYRSLVIDKVPGWRPGTHFVDFLRTPILQYTPRLLPLPFTESFYLNLLQVCNKRRVQVMVDDLPCPFLKERKINKRKFSLNILKTRETFKFLVKLNLTSL